jgi:hypothetical protein
VETVGLAVIRKEEEMAWELHSYIVNPDDEKVFMKHVFYGETKDECLQVKQEHLASCEYFRAAEEAGRTDDQWEEANSLPEV